MTGEGISEMAEVCCSLPSFAFASVTSAPSAVPLTVKSAMTRLSFAVISVFLLALVEFVKTVSVASSVESPVTSVLRFHLPHLPFHRLFAVVVVFLLLVVVGSGSSSSSGKITRRIPLALKPLTKAFILPEQSASIKVIACNWLIGSSISVCRRSIRMFSVS